MRIELLEVDEADEEEEGEAAEMEIESSEVVCGWGESEGSVGCRNVPCCDCPTSLGAEPSITTGRICAGAIIT
jgi:hypothetical protein